MPLRFLVVDDNAAHQRLMANVVMFFGGQFVTLASGLEVLDRVEREEFDIILMDLWMPQMGGIPTTAKLLDLYQERAGRPRIVAVTGLDTEERRALCWVIGMDGFVSKPYEVGTLKSALQQVVVHGHCWDGVAPQRLLNLDTLWAAVPNAQAPEAAEFEAHAQEARRCLHVLHDGTDDVCAHADWVEAFARRYGFMRLRQTMESLSKAARSGEHALFAEQVTEEAADFETTLIGARESFSESGRDSGPPPSESAG